MALDLCYKNPSALRYGSAISRLSSDIIQSCVFSRLDGPSLARCRAVCRSWKSLASSDILWSSLCCKFWACRMHLPLQIVLPASGALPAMKAFSITMKDFLQDRLSPLQMCSRTWEVRLKAAAGNYWLNFDPSVKGEAPLLRFFNCDGTLSAPDADPIWGGHGCYWKFMLVSESDCLSQYVIINRWPPMLVIRLKDGRWQFGNQFGIYTTQADFDVRKNASYAKVKAACCSGCSGPRLMNARSAAAKDLVVMPSTPHQILERVTTITDSL